MHRPSEQRRLISNDMLPATCCREEEVFDREEVLGRDVSSVFRSRAPAAESNGASETDAIKEMLGARKFVTEKEVRPAAHTLAGSQTYLWHTNTALSAAATCG